MARPGSNFCLWNLQGWHHTIGTEKDYYEMGRGADDSPREWILEVEKAKHHVWLETHGKIPSQYLSDLRTQSIHLLLGLFSWCLQKKGVWVVLEVQELEGGSLDSWDIINV